MENEKITFKDNIWVDKGELDGNGKQTGIWKRYSNGKITSKYTYSNGIFHGYWETYFFHEKGVISQTSYFLRGKLNGINKIYDYEGIMESIIYYL